MDDKMVFYVGGILHNARMQECYGNSFPSWRALWPTTLKDFRTQQMAGQPWIDVAIAQVRALALNGVLK